VNSRERLTEIQPSIVTTGLLFAPLRIFFFASCHLSPFQDARRSCRKTKRVRAFFCQKDEKVRPSARSSASTVLFEPQPYLPPKSDTEYNRTNDQYDSPDCPFGLFFGHLTFFKPINQHNQHRPLILSFLPRCGDYDWIHGPGPSRRDYVVPKNDTSTMDETDGSLPYHVYQSDDYFLHDAIQNHHDAMHPSLFSVMTSHQLHRNKISSVGSISSSKTSLHARSTSKRSPSRSPGSVSVRRLENKEVRAIFECLHQHGPQHDPLPEYLKFKVVMGVLNGKRLSPPPFEYKGTKMNQPFAPCSLFCFFVHVNLSFGLHLTLSRLFAIQNIQTVFMFY
jgi:hypothetical protein